VKTEITFGTYRKDFYNAKSN